MSVHEPLPESLARKYEKFYHDVLALTESASDGHALNQLKEWQKLVSSSSAQSAEAAQQKSEASYNRRHLKRIYELLQVSDYDSAIDRLAELKKDQIDPAELSHLKSSLSGAQKDLHKVLEILEVDSVSDALPRLYSLLKAQNLPQSSSSE